MLFSDLTFFICLFNFQCIAPFLVDLEGQIKIDVINNGSEADIDFFLALGRHLYPK